MNVEKELTQRSNNCCELCKSSEKLGAYEIPPVENPNADEMLWLCEKCRLQLDKKEPLDSAHLKCLNESMWSEVSAVQIVSWRLLNRLKNESWAADALDMLYLDEKNLAWAKAAGDEDNSNEVLLHKDANGNILQNGDTVVLTKTLDVKGSSLNARLGTVVKGIRLVDDNHEQIEGKIEGQTIVILTKYLRKSS